MATRTLDDWIQEASTEALQHGDWKKFLEVHDDRDAMNVWCANKEKFGEMGVYEESLLYAWSLQRIAGHWSYIMRVYLALSNREKLSTIAPLPSSAIEQDGMVTVYRGVPKLSRKALARRREHMPEYRASSKYGLSWTLHIGTARIFTQRYTNHGVVYKARVNPHEIWAYIDSDRKERECLIPDARRLRIEVAERIKTTSRRCNITTAAGRGKLTQKEGPRDAEAPTISPIATTVSTRTPPFPALCGTGGDNAEDAANHGNAETIDAR